MKKGKKQELIFGGVNSAGHFVTASFTDCVVRSKADPIGLNRKTLRAIPLLIKGLFKNGTKTKEQINADRLQKEKRKKARKAASISRRINRAA